MSTRQKNNAVFMMCIIFPMLTIKLFGGENNKIDYRDIRTGSIIPDEDWGEQPLIVKLDNGRWFCVLTTGYGREGSAAQHIVFTISSDQGKTWTELKDIEPADGPEASCAVPFLVPSGVAKGRIYVFYTYNADDVREVMRIEGYMMSRVDLLGKYTFKYTDDQGATWSERHYLPYRTTIMDLANITRGKIKMFWGNDKPHLDRGQLFFGFSKIGNWGGQNFITSTEGWLWRCDNILEEKDVTKLKWTMLPDGDFGLNAPAGIVCEEHMLTLLSDGSLFCVARTTQGHPVQYYSRDRGHTWTETAYMSYSRGGRFIAHPRANCPVWKLANGKYLFWFHNHTGNPAKSFSDRNPVWISGGVEVDSPDGKIIEWSEPEILLYGEAEMRKVGVTYPDFLEEDGEFYISETQESIARTHKIDRNLLEGLWGQFDAEHTLTEKDLITSFSAEDLSSPSVKKIGVIDNFKEEGATIDFKFKLPKLQRVNNLLDTSNGRHGWKVSVDAKGVMFFDLFDGSNKFSWKSDAGIIKAGKTQHVTLVMDSRAGIFYALVDGIFCDSTNDSNREFGWGQYKNINTINSDQPLQGKMHTIKAFRLYRRALRTSEAVANYRATLE